MNIPIIFGILQNSLFLKFFKKIVKTKIIPLFARMNFFSKLKNVNGKIIFVPYIQTGFKKIFTYISFLLALRVRGHRIILLTCNKGLKKCEAFTTRNSLGECGYCQFVDYNFLKKLDIDIIHLNELIANKDKNYIDDLIDKDYSKIINGDKYFFNGIDISLAVNDSIVRYGYGTIPNNKKIIKQYIETAMISVIASEKIYSTYKPDIVVNNMSVYAEYEPYESFFKNKNTPIYSIKSYAWNANTFKINPNHMYKNNNRFKTFLNNRNHQPLTAKEEDELNNFIDKRFSGSSYEFKYYNYFDSQDKNIKNRLKIDEKKKNIFLFTSLEWDVGLSDCDTIFDGILDWVLCTINCIKDNENIHLYIKTHPNEYFGEKSKISFKDKIQSHFDYKIDNLSFIEPEIKILTYDLFDFIDLGITYYGTVGLEMALKGIPVLVAGKSPYSDLGFTIDSTNRDDYEDNLVRSHNSFSIDYEVLKNFCYFYFIKAEIPITILEDFYVSGSKNPNYNINNIEDLAEGKDYYLDHFCDVIINGKHPESY